ncbi:MAG: aminotransferase [Sphingomonadales bacterium]
MKEASTVLSGYGTTIFTVMSALAQKHDAINLGQGFPDHEGPDDVRQVAAEALLKGSNQYPAMMGVPELRQAVAEHESRFHGRDIDWQSQVLVTSGATEALAAAMMALLNPGDEVVLFEPLYDSYLPIIELTGARPRLVRLAPPDWTMPNEALEAAFSERTKLVVLNSPMNPIGKVFTEAELSRIARLVRKFDAYALCDEVYEHLVFSDCRHLPLGSLPGMAERTVRIGSAGKTFSLTGWKVGYLTGPEALIGAIAKAHQYLTFTTAPNLQRAVAYGLRKDDQYFKDIGKDLERKRDILAAGLADIGFNVLPCGGTYFVGADFRPLGFDGSDVEFCELITRQAGVSAIPMSAFYHEGGIDHVARFCFCKDDAMLREAVNRLDRFFRGQEIQTLSHEP